MEHAIYLEKSSMDNQVKVGDLAKYLSRTLLVVDIDDVWVPGSELDEVEVGMYKKAYVKLISSTGCDDETRHSG